MSAIIVLAVIGLFQSAFLVLLVIFLGVRRHLDDVRDVAFVAGREALSEPLSAWLGGGGAVEPFVVALRSLPGRTALGYVGNLARTTIPPAERAVLARALRDEPWVHKVLAGATSSRWGRRLDAARCLALAGAPTDGAVLESLLNDSRPAVAIAAVNALPRVADAQFVARLLDRLVVLPHVVALYLQGTLREMRELVEPPLAERLSKDASPRALARWTELAGALELPQALDRVALLADHPDAQVRQATARALRRVPRQRSVDILQRLLGDSEAGVRAVAAHALGELASTGAIPALIAAAHDPALNVRYRATLALTQLGEPGRAAVRSLRTDGDRYVADIATLVIGLGDGALLDMVEA